MAIRMTVHGRRFEDLVSPEYGGWSYCLHGNVSVMLTSGSSASLDDLRTPIPTHVYTALIHLAPPTNSTKDKGISLKFE